jgi:biotin operon repressor
MIRSFMDTTGVAYPSNHWIADQLGINRRNVINNINKLISKGYIERIEENCQRYFRITLSKVLEKGVSQKTPPSVAEDTPPSVAEDTPPSVAEDTQLYSNIILSNIITTGNEISDEIVVDDDPVKVLKKYEINPPRVIKQYIKKYIDSAVAHLATHGFSLDEYLNYLTNRCQRALLPYITNGVQRQNGFGNILRPSFINDVINGKWAD